MSRNSNAYDMVPPAIRPLVSQRHILPSEDPKLYDALFGHIAELMKPANVLQWLDIKKLQDLIWEQMRLSRIKPGIIQSARKSAMSSLFQSTANQGVRDYTRSGNVGMGEANAIEWFINPDAREELEETLGQFGYSHDTVDAVAFVQQLDALMAVDGMQTSNEMRQAVIRTRLEEERSVLQLHPVPDDHVGEAPARPQLEHDTTRNQEHIEAKTGDDDVEIDKQDAA